MGGIITRQTGLRWIKKVAEHELVDEPENKPASKAGKMAQEVEVPVAMPDDQS